MGVRKSAKRLIKLAKKNPNLYTREDVIYAKLIKKQQDERKISEVNISTVSYTHLTLPTRDDV